MEKEIEAMTETQATLGEKATKWFKENIFNFIILFVCIIYVGRGLLTAEPTHKSIVSIITDISISFVFGMTIKILLSMKGMTSGINSSVFKATKREHSKVIDKITPNIEYLDNYCDIENARVLKKKQMVYLASNAISYECITNEEKYNNLTLEKQQIVDKARKFKITPLTSSLLLVESSGKEDSDIIENISLSKEITKSALIKSLSTIASSIVFGLVAVKRVEEVGYIAILWSALQVGMFVLMGILEYYKKYNYVVDDYRNNILRKINKLYMFDNMCQKDITIFKKGETNGNNKTTI